MGFRTKLVLSYIFLIALITGSFYLYFDHSLQKGMIEESRANLASQAQGRVDDELLGVLAFLQGTLMA